MRMEIPCVRMVILVMLSCIYAAFASSVVALCQLVSSRGLCNTLETRQLCRFRHRHRHRHRHRFRVTAGERVSRPTVSSCTEKAVALDGRSATQRIRVSIDTSAQLAPCRFSTGVLPLHLSLCSEDTGTVLYCTVSPPRARLTLRRSAVSCLLAEETADGVDSA
ncbi:hypothetical protein BJ546DRAFT_362565 [Cryomyces antarcticus]